MKQKHESYLYNPYKVIGLTEKMYTTKSDETLTIDPETGEYYTMRKIGKNKRALHDELVYAKLFTNNLNQLMSLSHSSLKLLMYAMCTVRPLSQTVMITQEDACNSCNFASSTFWNAVHELLDKKLLSKKLGSSIEFWFDPNVFFNGNRLRINRHSGNSVLNLEDEV